jgi:MraZ protein
MLRFRGSSTHNLDAKGRIIIPSRFRDVIRVGGNDAIMVTCRDKGLVAYTLSEWQKIESKILDRSNKNDHMRRFLRVFVGNAHECQFDKQNRVLIPPSQRSYAELVKEIVLVGVLDHFEIWSKVNWEKENDAMESDMSKEEVRNDISRLGL